MGFMINVWNTLQNIFQYMGPSNTKPYCWYKVVVSEKTGQIEQNK